MNKIKIIKTFISELRHRFGYRVWLIVVLGMLSSFLQGIGIMMIIPLLELYSGKNSSSQFEHILNEIGWNGSLEVLLLFYFILLLSFGLIKAFNTLISQKIIITFSNDFNVDAIRKIFAANWEFHLKIGPSKIVNLFKSESKSVRLLTFQFFRLLQSVTMVIIQLVLALWISIKLTMVSIGMLGFLYLIQRFVFKRNFNLGDMRVSLGEKLQLFLNESFGAIKLLKLHHQEHRRSEEYADHVKKLYRNEISKAKSDAVSELLFIFSGAILIMLVIYLGLSFEWLSIGALLVLLVLISRVISQTQSLVTTTASISNQLPSYNRFTQLLAEANESVKRQEEKDVSVMDFSKVQFSKVNFSYQSDSVLNNVDFSFEKGKIYLLFGESGKGKTTTLDLLSGLMQPDTGNILVDGKPLTEGVRYQFQNSLSYALQETILFRGTMKENVTLFQDIEIEKVREAVSLAGLSTLVESKPEKLDYLISENGKGLSGGEKQRIAIARALVRNSQIMLFDEVTNSLDRKNEMVILETLKTLKTDRIIILVSHKEALKDFVDEVIEF